MRLTTLRLPSFRSYVGAEINLNASRVLIAGVNGSGKSSLRESVRWLLTGHCDVTDARGVGAELLMPEGATTVEVEADSSIGKLFRGRGSRSGEFNVEGVKGESSLHQQALYLKLNTTPEFLDAVLDTANFLRLHHGDAKALVLSLLNVTIPVELTYPDIPGSGVEWIALEQLEARYKAAFEERKAAKVRLRSHAVPAAPTEQFPAVVDVEAQLSRLRAELAELQTGAGATVGRRQSLQEAVRKAEARMPVEEPSSSLTARIEALEAELAALPVPEAATAPVKAPEGLAERVAWLKDRAEAIKAFDPSKGCVLDADIVCPQTKRQFGKRVREIGIELEAMPPLAGTPPPPAPTLERLRREHIQHDLGVLRPRLSATVNSEAFNANQEQEQTALTAQLASLGDADPAQAEALSALQARIAKGEMVLKHATAYAGELLRRERALKEHAVIEGEVDRLEALCETLGPNGVRVQALDAAIGSFTEAINATLSTFGWTVAFELEPWRCLVNGRPVQTYSESEQFRVGIGLQLAIAQLSGLSFAIIDRLDMLDVTNRGLATKMILSSPLEQILILATREPQQELPTVPGLIAHRLGKVDGRSVILESTGV